MKIKRIKFIWNADFNIAGGVNAIKEAISGEHTCSLCDIAYHRVRQTSEWKGYKKRLKKQLDCDVNEPCRNQISPAEKEALNGVYPAVIAWTDEGLTVLLAGDDIDSCDGDFSVFSERLDRSISSLLNGE